MPSSTSSTTTISSPSSRLASKPSRSSPSSRPQHSSRTTSNRPVPCAQKTEIRINVYDLLPPSHLATVLWKLGTSLLHTGVVIRGREYAYGGHDRLRLTGVYHTKPGLEPPGGTWRTHVLQGFTIRSDAEIETVIKEASERFQGTSYSLLENNCNHFTSYLCQQLTGQPAPKFINRAASIAVVLPVCVVPREWVAPPDYETAEGELLEDDDDERTRMLRKEEWRRYARVSEDEQESWDGHTDRTGESGRSSRRSHTYQHRPRVVTLQDKSGKELPASERAPLPWRAN